MIRFVADMGVSISTVEALRDLSYDGFHLAERGLERLDDDEILSLARHEGRVVVAFDLISAISWWPASMPSRA